MTLRARSHARLLGVAVLAAALIVPISVTSADSSASAAPVAGRDWYDIPSAATVRPLGDVVQGPCAGFFPTGCDGNAGFFPNSLPGMGVPLGGIGAGSFMINQSGMFGPWYFGGSQSDAWEVRTLPQAALHVREQIGDGPAEVRTLATDGVENVGANGPVPSRSWEGPLPAWNTLETGDADYSALYPFGWMTYKPFATDISMRFHSPIVAGDDRRSSLPVAYFDVRIANHTDEQAEVSTMFTMPNAPAHVGKQPATIREGLSSSYEVDETTGIHAVTLSADSESNTPDAYKSEWTVAAKVDEGQSVSYTTSWDGEGDGSDIYDLFSSDGSLNDGALDDSASAGAVAVSATLEPGEVTTIPFVLTWDFPEVGFADNNTVWMRRYTNFYGAQTNQTNDYVPGTYQFNQSYEIARDALNESEQNLADVKSWWSPIAESGDYPDWMSESALNHLANVPFHTSLWEGGLVRNSVPVITGEDRIGTSVPDTHNYLGVDSNAGGVSTLGMGGEVGIYSNILYTEMFPSIERDRLRGKVEAILAGTTAGDPSDFGMTGSTDPAAYNADGDPFVTWNQGATPGPGRAWFLDRPSENIFRMYDYAQRHDDKAFLEFAYPAMEKTFAFLQQTIPADLPLPEVPSALNPKPDLSSPIAMSNIYNIIPSDRFDSYTSMLYLLALESMIAAGEQVNEDPARIADLKDQLVAAKNAFETTFWSEQNGYYRYTLPQGTPENDSVLLTTFLAQSLAERAGLPDLVQPERYRQHLESMYPLVSGKTDAAGRLTGAINMGLPAGSTQYPLVGTSGTIYEPNVWPGANYAAGATYFAAGERFGSDRLKQDGLTMASAVSAQIWDVRENGYEFNAPFQYDAVNPARYIYPSFENNLAIWQLIDVVRPDPATETPGTTPTPGDPAPGDQPATETSAIAQDRLAATGQNLELPMLAGAVLLIAGLVLLRRRSRRLQQ
ncbi:GH116 family glycosyl-hydrolase [Agreia sp. Leaf283]|uniref:GH116 family glycosyl-hydrolase n=1 Tax=Agreia sp. Leaf283 TaxID=1736321 RepID=UPI00070026C2|nr:GH116 family glycosyl-hydrolase [Agreia sp. Leaf283]